MKKGFKTFYFILAVCIFFPFFSYADVKNVNVNQAENLVKSSSYIVVDVRTAGEYNSGHIKGAKNIDFYNNFEEMFAKQFPDKNKPYLIYCRSGNRSFYAAKMLSEMGYKDVTNMEGGIIVWSNSGKKLE